MKCKQMDIIYNIFDELPYRQTVIAIDILRILFNKRKQGMNIIELNRYFRNRYTHSVKSTIRWLKEMGYIIQSSGNGIGMKYIITLAGIKKYWEIWGKLKRCAAT